MHVFMLIFYSVAGNKETNANSHCCSINIRDIREKKTALRCTIIIMLNHFIPEDLRPAV